jgi:TetR/AcrR family transcriptional repressor of mexJK operon
MATTNAAQKSNGVTSKRDAILEAAARVFFESGYADASMDEIAREAGVSKQTVYSHFGAKEALFGDFIRDNCERLLEPISAPEIRAKGPGAALTGIARRYLDLILEPQALALFRTILAESGRFPELAETFYRSGPLVAIDNLADYLSALDSEGVLRMSDPRLAARLFFGMLREDFYFRLLLGCGESPNKKEVERTVSQAVDMFLAAYAGNG